MALGLTDGFSNVPWQPSWGPGGWTGMESYCMCVGNIIWLGGSMPQTGDVTTNDWF